MDRLAVPVPGDDLLTPFLDRVPPAARARPGHGLPDWPMATLPRRRPRYEPRNLDFAAGLDRWDLDAGPGSAPDSEPDYAAAAEADSAVLSSSVPRPAGSAALVQAIFADDYRGATVTFSAEIRADPLTEQAGLRLEIIRNWWRAGGPARTTASPSPATAPGPGTRSRRGSPRTPTRSGSASRSPAPAGSRCGTRTCALIPKPTPSRPPERRERGRLRRRTGPAGPRR